MESCDWLARNATVALGLGATKHILIFLELRAFCHSLMLSHEFFTEMRKMILLSAPMMKLKLIP